MNRISRYKMTLAGLLAGAAAGYLYYYFIGCNSGTCPITSNPLYSTLYGTIMGGLLLNGFEKSSKRNA